MRSLINSPFKKIITLDQFVDLGGSANKLCSKIQLGEVLVEHFEEVPNLKKELSSGVLVKYLEIGATCVRVITTKVDKLITVPLENIVIWLPVFIPEDLLENK